MQHTTSHAPTRSMDALRLLGLSRIPRCAGCPRFETLRSAFESGAVATRPLPPVPSYCAHQVCAPLVARLAAPPLPAGGLRMYG